jgi:hypothetical protein
MAVEFHFRRFDVEIERLGRVCKAADAIVRVEKIHGDVEHHGIGCGDASGRPGFQQRSSLCIGSRRARRQFFCQRLGCLSDFCLRNNVRGYAELPG